MNTNTNLVSVVIPAFNEEKYIKKSITSILNQTYQNFEILVLDDASTDNTTEIVKSIGDYRITLIENKTNQGVVKNLNTALNVAKGKYFARMDADDMSLPDRLEKQVRLMESDDNCAMTGTGVCFLNYRQQEFKNKIPVLDDKGIRQEMLTHNPVNTGSAMYRKKLLLEVGGFNPEHNRGEGYSILLKLAQLGTIRNIPDVGYVYFIRGEGQNRCFDSGFKYRNSAMVNMTRAAGDASPGMFSSFKAFVAGIGWRVYHLLPRTIQVYIRSKVTSEKHQKLSNEDIRRIEAMYEQL
jgi:glycosyltransferase involved in cell wall biosynthesis